MSPLFGKTEQRYERLLEVQRKISLMTDLDQALRQIVATASEWTESEACSILLFEADTGLLKFAAAHPDHWSSLQRMRVPVENSIAGLCYSRSQTLALKNAEKDKRVFRDVDRALSFITRSIMAAPLIFRGRTIGVLEALNKKGRAPYTQAEATILEALADQAAQIIETTHLVEQVRLAQQETRYLEKAKADFIAITSHELRTPLGPILGHAAILCESLTDPDLHSQAAVIVENANRLRQLIESLANADRAIGAKTRPLRAHFNLANLLDEVVASFRTDLERKSLSLLTDYPHEGLQVDGDAEKLAIALSNLLKNAITFTDENGHILVTGEKLPGYIKVSFVDDGIGIPPDDLQRIFERFYQVSAHMTRRHGGMGLGLSVAKAMVELHNGQIWVESSEGQGSNFSILLPAGECPGDRAADQPKVSAFILDEDL